MLRRLASLLLVAGLIVLSGIDLWEDLRTPDNGSVFHSPAKRLPQLGQGQTLANDIVESAGRPRPAAADSTKGSPVGVKRDHASLSFKPRQLHKLKRVFLI